MKFGSTHLPYKRYSASISQPVVMILSVLVCTLKPDSDIRYTLRTPIFVKLKTNLFENSNQIDWVALAVHNNTYIRTPNYKNKEKNNEEKNTYI